MSTDEKFGAAVRIILAIAILAVLAAITGCGRGPTVDPYAITVEEHALPDGTRCAVLVQYSKPYGLDCEWRQDQQPTRQLPQPGFINAQGEPL